MHLLTYFLLIWHICVYVVSVSPIELKWEHLLNKRGEDLRKKSVAPVRFAELDAEQLVQSFSVRLSCIAAKISRADSLVYFLILHLCEYDGDARSFLHRR